MTSPWSLFNSETGETVVEHLEIADGFRSRWRGLQFRRRLPHGRGLLLVPCSSIHTLCTFFPLDVIFLSGQGRVLEVRSKVRPWRIVAGPRITHATLEMLGGTTTARTGDWLQIVAPTGSHAPLPASVEFLRG